MKKIIAITIAIVLAIPQSTYALRPLTTVHSGQRNIKETLNRPTMSLRKAYNFMKDRMSFWQVFDGLEGSYEMAKAILKHDSIKKVMIVGTGQVELAFLLALVGKEVVFVDTNNRLLAQVKEYFATTSEILSRCGKKEQSDNLRLVCIRGKIGSLRLSNEKWRQELGTFLTHISLKYFQKVQVPEVLQRGRKLLKRKRKTYQQKTANTEPGQKVKNLLLFQTSISY